MDQARIGDENSTVYGQSSRESGGSLKGSFVPLVKRALPVVMAFTLVVSAISTVLALFKPTLYRANTVVLINRQNLASQVLGTSDASSQQTSFQQVLVTQAKLARTPSVLKQTVSQSKGLAKALDQDTLRQISQVNPEPNSDLLRFTVDRGVERDAKLLSVKYATAYIDYKRKIEGAALESAINDSKASRTRSLKGGDKNKALTESLSQRIEDLETRKQLQAQNAVVVSGPQDTKKVQPKPLRAALVGGFLGLLLGLVAALVRERFDTRVRTVRDAEALTDLPTLGRIPAAAGSGDGLVILDDAGSNAAESFRILRANLEFGIASQGIKTLMVTSATPGEGKSTTIANLAVASAIAGRSVALVDLDLRKPKIAEIFAIPHGKGVTSTIIADVEMDEVLHHVNLPGRSEGHLSVIGSGPVPPDPGEIVGSDPVKSLIDQLKQRVDLVLLDVPPMVGISDALTISQYADALVFCVKLGEAKKPELIDTVGVLGRLDCSVLGQVVTNSDADKELNISSYYDYYHGAVDQMSGKE